MNSLRFFVPLLTLLALAVAPSQAQETALAADFKLRDQANQEVSLAKFKDKKAIVVIFTSAHCSWATKYEERIKAIYQTYQAKNIAFIAINSNDSSMSVTDAAARIRQDSPYTFPYLKDDDQAVARLFKVTKTPEVVVLTPSAGRFLISYRGKIDDNPLDSNMVRNNYLTEALEAILAGKRPVTPETPASGCNIRWMN